MVIEDPGQLLRSASAGDGNSIEALLERHLPGLLAYVRLHAVGAPTIRDTPTDLVQSVCREVLQSASHFEYRGEGPFRNWLYKLALAKIQDRQRYWHAQKRAMARERSSVAFALRSPDSSPSEVAIREEDMQRLEQTFARLPPDYRKVVTLAYVVGLSRREIAAEMQRSEGAVRVLLHRAVARVGFLLSDPHLLGVDPLRDAP